MDLSDLFPAQDYQFRMGVRRGEPKDFFRPSSDHERVLAERRRWLAEDPAAYLGLLPGGAPLLDEVIALAGEWQVFDQVQLHSLSSIAEPGQRLRALGEQLEPDLLFLAPGENGRMHLLAGCVCFPSSWPLEEKMGHPMAVIHEPAPGLHDTLGKQIETFLAKLAPGIAWLRSNWGLSASAELNQHPSRKLPRLTGDVDLDRVWLRVERQVLIRLPATGGVLFGIQIESHRLSDVKEQSPPTANGLANALRTMPEEIARYKGISAVRTMLAELLTTRGS